MDAMERSAPVDASGQRALRLGMDTRLLVVTLFLMALGLSVVLSSSSYFAGGKFGDHFALMRNHAGRCVVALIVMFLASLNEAGRRTRISRRQVSPEPTDVVPLVERKESEPVLTMGRSR